jgi:hypothetical protein
MTPRHLVPIEPADAVSALCDRIGASLPNSAIVVMLELAAFRDTQTPHDANRLIRALRHVADREDLAAQVEVLLD